MSTDLNELTRPQLVAHVLQLKRQNVCLNTELMRFKMLIKCYEKLFDLVQTSGDANEWCDSQSAKLRQQLTVLNSVKLFFIDASDDYLNKRNNTGQPLIENGIAKSLINDFNGKNINKMIDDIISIIDDNIEDAGESAENAAIETSDKIEAECEPKTGDDVESNSNLTDVEEDAQSEETVVLEKSSRDANLVNGGDSAKPEPRSDSALSGQSEPNSVTGSESDAFPLHSIIRSPDLRKTVKMPNICIDKVNDNNEVDEDDAEERSTRSNASSKSADTVENGDLTAPLKSFTSRESNTDDEDLSRVVKESESFDDNGYGDNDSKSPENSTQNETPAENYGDSDGSVERNKRSLRRRKVNYCEDGTNSDASDKTASKRAKKSGKVANTKGSSGDKKFVCEWPDCDYRTATRGSLSTHNQMHLRRNRLSIIA